MRWVLHLNLLIDRLKYYSACACFVCACEKKYVRYRNF